MITTQLLSAYDDMAGGASGQPVPVAALLAHLLFLREVGGLARPTALTDTFGTSAFIQVGSPATALIAEMDPSQYADSRAKLLRVWPAALWCSSCDNFFPDTGCNWYLC